MHKLFTVCTEQAVSPYTEHAASAHRAPAHTAFALCEGTFLIKLPGSSMRRQGTYIFSWSSNGMHIAPFEK